MVGWESEVDGSDVGEATELEMSKLLHVISYPFIPYLLTWKESQAVLKEETQTIIVLPYCHPTKPSKENDGKLVRLGIHSYLLLMLFALNSLGQSWWSTQSCVSTDNAPSSHTFDSFSCALPLTMCSSHERGGPHYWLKSAQIQSKAQIQQLVRDRPIQQLALDRKASFNISAKPQELVSLD